MSEGSVIMMSTQEVCDVKTGAMRALAYAIISHLYDALKIDSHWVHTAHETVRCVQHLMPPEPQPANLQRASFVVAVQSLQLL